MNDIDKKIEQVQDILALALEISTTSSISVFVSYASHIQIVDILVYLQGWEYGKTNTPDYKNKAYLDWEDWERRLKEIKEYLIQLKKEAILNENKCL